MNRVDIKKAEEKRCFLCSECLNEICETRIKPGISYSKCTQWITE